ncbi:DSBA oxidoreductase [Catenovulum agarivorans DS-2]|uniref:DSBA oxidoreductase n=1 Tax=Catenovulum agarivorans DS-2 TaxID=1328313 RepID=W7QQT0_9ALTE|nr:DsbA family protein [Catenovulum agarivorans]EWH10238.1 DSBA oxidoreductase [Catenovulum agarivorans DS-2]
MIQVEFFHDAVCGWCYIQSPRLRKIVENFPVEVIHRSFVLQRNNQEMIDRFGSMAKAKNEILTHWKQCKNHSDNPELINIAGMEATTFDYPTGHLAARYAKAVERLYGQKGHWDFFDTVQKAHLFFNQNINDSIVLDGLVEQLGFALSKIQQLMALPQNLEDIEADMKRAAELGVNTIPALLFNGKNLVSQTVTYEQLIALLNAEFAGSILECK